MPAVLTPVELKPSHYDAYTIYFMKMIDFWEVPLRSKEYFALQGLNPIDESYGNPDQQKT